MFLLPIARILAPMLAHLPGRRAPMPAPRQANTLTRPQARPQAHTLAHTLTRIRAHVLAHSPACPLAGRLLRRLPSPPARLRPRGPSRRTIRPHPRPIARLPTRPRAPARSHPRPHLLALLLAASCPVSPLQAMTFALADPVDLPGSGMRPSHMILAEGPIRAGDAEVFAAFMATLAPTNHYEGVQWGVVLNSPGGSLSEGVRLGEAFRAHVVTTVVLDGHACESACAVAYLGGAAMYATALAAERLLQPGGRLGFHGFAVAADTVGAANDTLDLARTTNAVIRDYAIRMGVADDGLVQALFNTPPEAMEYIDTPAEILGLRVSLTVDAIRPPADWALNACRHSVSVMLGDLRMFEDDDRVADRPERLAGVEAFRRALLAARAGVVGELHEALAAAPAGTAIDLLAGRALYLDPAAADVWRVGLGRGAGFYYDSCFAVGGDWALTTLVVDEVAGALRVESHGMLRGYPPDQPLW